MDVQTKTIAHACGHGAGDLLSLHVQMIDFACAIDLPHGDHQFPWWRRQMLLMQEFAALQRVFPKEIWHSLYL